MTNQERILGLKKEKWYSKYVETVPELNEKVVAVTGTTSGTGFYVVIAAIRKHAKVVFVLNRSSPRVEKSLKDFDEEKKRVNSTTEIVQIDCDLMSFESVKNAALILKKEIADHNLHGVHVLVNNAGIAGVPPPRTKDGYQSQIQVNYLSHYLLVELIKDELERASETSKSPSRIVNVASGMRWFGSFNKNHYQKCDDKLEKTDLYPHTKVANTLFNYEFNSRNDVSKVFALGADPGLSNTDIFEQKGDNKRKSEDGLVAVILRGMGMSQSAQDGALPIIEAAFGAGSEPGDYITPGGPMTFYGKPRKIIAKGKSQWWFYRESNVLDPKAQKELGEVSREIVKQHLSSIKVL